MPTKIKMETKQKWTFKEWTSSIGETGDYDSGVEFTNGKDTLQTSGEDLETEDLQKFCELMDMMPDLWSYKTDATEFENSQLKKQVEHLKNALDKIYKIEDGAFGLNSFDVKRFKSEIKEAIAMNDVF